MIGLSRQDETSSLTTEPILNMIKPWPDSKRSKTTADKADRYYGEKMFARSLDWVSFVPSLIPDSPCSDPQGF